MPFCDSNLIISDQYFALPIKLFLLLISLTVINLWIWSISRIILIYTIKQSF